MWIGVHPLAQAMLGRPTVQAFTERSGVVHFIYTYLLDASQPGVGRCAFDLALAGC